jgi:3-O-alpha-D-mannopyranosyl-alpha-D-mannopyranose xylosylphosphotransferase
VANIGTLERGIWGTDAREEIADLFGLGVNDQDVVKIEVHKHERWTLEPERLEKTFEHAGWEAPKATEMLFCE